MRNFLTLILILVPTLSFASEWRRNTRPSLITVQASRVDAANNAMEKVSPYAKNVFSTPYSTRTDRRITHYICNIRLTEDQLKKFQGLMASNIQYNRVVIYDKSQTQKAKKATLADKNMKPVYPEVEK